jgi:hypothetical protein
LKIGIKHYVYRQKCDEKGRKCLIYLWGEEVSTATYIVKNPTKRLKAVTPEEA